MPARSSQTAVRSARTARSVNGWRCPLMVVCSGITLYAGLPQFVCAQPPVTIQQPVVETFSAATTVVVPDRGSALIGGVSRGATSRSRYGRGPQSNVGQEYSQSSLQSSVYIHDLAAMDEALLNSVGESTLSAGFAEPRRIGEKMSRSAITAPVAQPEAVDIAAERVRWEKLAQAAEARGSRAVARLHWKQAEKRGSVLARSALAAEVPARPASTTARHTVVRSTR